MALFGSKKKEEKFLVSEPKAKNAAKTKAVVVASKAVVIPTSNTINTLATSTIIRPHITEKSGLLSQGGVYTFVISAKANKDSISKAVKTLYKVTPVKIALINNPSKRVFVRGRRGLVSGIRKAVVTVKKGDKIEFV